MTTDLEMTAISAAYAALEGMTTAQWQRALNYLGDRLAGDDRTAFVASLGQAHPEPTQWVIRGDLDIREPTREAAVLESIEEAWTPIEVNGVAIVSQEWAVITPDDDGREVYWFARRELADLFITAAMQDGINTEHAP
jgi:hypothetical protein